MNAWKSVVLAAAFVAAGACGSTEPAAGIEGTYALATVNGEAIPAAVNVAGASLNIRAGSLTVGEGSYVITLDDVNQSTAVGSCGVGCERDEADGTWSAAPSGGYTFNDALGSAAGTATLDGRTLTVAFETGATFTFARR